MMWNSIICGGLLVIAIVLIVWTIKVSKRNEEALNRVLAISIYFDKEIKSAKDVLKLNTICDKYELLALRPYILAIMHTAVENENFKEAAECKKIVNEIERLVREIQGQSKPSL